LPSEQIRRTSFNVRLSEDAGSNDKA